MIKRLYNQYLSFQRWVIVAAMTVFAAIAINGLMALPVAQAQDACASSPLP